MPELIEIIAPHGPIRANVSLPLSKSFCNRALVLEKVSNGLVRCQNISDADDSRILKDALHQMPSFIYAGAGGTTLRFLLPVLCAIPGYSGQIAGSERLMQRPIQVLIDALGSLGADVQLKQGIIYVSGKKLKGGKLTLPQSATSQFASALILAAPMFEQGLELKFSEPVPSATYLQMTVQMMQMAGFDVQHEDSQVKVKPGYSASYTFKPEYDWSSASYWYGMAALKPGSSIVLTGLSLDSLQADQMCSSVFRLLGVVSESKADGIHIQSGSVRDFSVHFDVDTFPDLFQTLAFTLAGMGKLYSFSGLSTLRVKETDRIAAVQSQLKKIAVRSEIIGNDLLRFDARGLKTSSTVIFESFDDHRMAMSAAMLSTVLWKAAVRDPFVVSKSFPAFWQELRNAGFSVRELES